MLTQVGDQRLPVITYFVRFVIPAQAARRSPNTQMVSRLHAESESLGLTS